MKPSTIIKKIRTVPHYSQTPHQRGARSGERCTNVSALFAQSSNHLRSKPEARFQQVCTQKPSFSSPPSTALFFFSAHGEKEEGGAFQQTRCGCISQQKNGIPKREGSPSSKRAPLPGARRPGKSAGRAPRGTPCPARGTSLPAEGCARPKSAESAAPSGQRFSKDSFYPSAGSARLQSKTSDRAPWG